MDGTELLPVLAQTGQRISFADTSDLILICYDIHRQTGDLLLIARVIEVGIEDSVWRDHDLRRRSEFACAGSKGIHSLDRIVGKHRSEAVFDRQIPSVHGRMVAVDSRKFLHHLYLATLDLRVAQVVILIPCPSGAHENLHAMLCRCIHDGIDRALTPLGILPSHQLRRIVGLAFIGHGHEHEILHAHLLHLGNLRRPHLRIGIVDMRRIRVLVAHILIREVDECTCNRKDLFNLDRRNGSSRFICHTISTCCQQKDRRQQ